MQYHTVADWLAWQESLNPREIDMGLDRVSEVFARMALDFKSATIITVAGTNGKGSTIELLNSMLACAGYQVGEYTSPHLFRYNERIKIQGKNVKDDSLLRAFNEVEQARQDVALTYFEFGTLAALWCFAQQKLDVILLEVGMGGRLDAVNIIDPDVSIITSVGVDHVDWLGKDRDSIALEKAGILRSGKPMVCGDLVPPMSLQQKAKELNVKYFYINYDFVFQKRDQYWDWSHLGEKYTGLPFPSIAGECQLRNAASALMALSLLREKLPVSEAQIHEGLGKAQLPGRYQTLKGDVPSVFDVAHNPQSCKELAKSLEKDPVSGQTHAVVAMLKDKDFIDCVLPLMDLVDDWYVADLEVERAAKASDLANDLKSLRKDLFVHVANSVKDAYEVLVQTARPGDRIVVFGSFYAVSQVLPEN